MDTKELEPKELVTVIPKELQSGLSPLEVTLFTKVIIDASNGYTRFKDPLTD